MSPIELIMRTAPVIPVLVIDDASDARPIAESLLAGGLPVIEVTLRTPAAIDAIREISSICDVIVGAGTVLNESDLHASMHAGAQFAVSPGLTESLCKSAARSGIPYLPGVASASDILRGVELGLSHFKFFPATANGGIAALKSLAAPFGDMKFCPTGGIRMESAPDWLALESVLCVGGSWLVAKGPPDRAAITAAASKAAALRKRTS